MATIYFMIISLKICNFGIDLLEFQPLFIWRQLVVTANVV